MIDLKAIRANRGKAYRDVAEELRAGRNDRADLLAYVDALRAAAGKVTCETCRGTGIERTLVTACPDCTDLRKLLEVGHE